MRLRERFPGMVLDALAAPVGRADPGAACRKSPRSSTIRLPMVNWPSANAITWHDNWPSAGMRHLCAAQLAQISPDSSVCRHSAPRRLYRRVALRPDQSAPYARQGTLAAHGRALRPTGGSPRPTAARPLPTPGCFPAKSIRQRHWPRSRSSVPDKIAVFCPGVEYGPAKRWPARHFAALADELAQRGHRIWLLGSGKDRAIAEDIARQAKAPLGYFADELRWIKPSTSLPSPISSSAMDSGVDGRGRRRRPATGRTVRLVVTRFHATALGTGRGILTLGLSCKPLLQTRVPARPSRLPEHTGAITGTRCLPERTRLEASA